jgi:hypothetical protein
MVNNNKNAQREKQAKIAEIVAYQKKKLEETNARSSSSSYYFLIIFVVVLISAAVLENYGALYHMKSKFFPYCN